MDDTFSNLFKEIPHIRAIVCKPCGCVVLPNAVPIHLRMKHKAIPVNQRNDIINTVTGLANRGSIAESVDGITYPDPGEPAIPWIPQYTDGKKCVLGGDGNPCQQLYRTVAAVQAHCKDAHDWINRRPPGGRPGQRPAGGLGDAWVDGVRCQRLGQTGSLQHWFEVTAVAATIEPGSEMVVGSSGPGVVWRDMTQMLEAIEEGDRAAADEIQAQDRISSQRWVRRAGWARHLQGFDRAWLVELTQKPDPAAAAEAEAAEDAQQRVERDERATGGSNSDSGSGSEDEEDEERVRMRVRAEQQRDEVALAAVVLAMERLVWRAQQSSKAEVVGWAAMNYVERREAGGQSNEAPFKAGQKGATMQKYADTWIGVMVYIWRSSRYERASRFRADEGVDDSKGAGDFEADDVDDIEDVESEDADDVEDVENIERAESSDAHGEDGEEPGQGVAIRDQRPAWKFTAGQREAFDRMSTEARACADRNEDPPTTERLEHSMMEFIIALFDHNIQDDQYVNAFCSGLAVLGVDREHGWKTALVYTPRLSAVVTVLRMLVLHQAVCQRQREIRRRRRQYEESEETAHARSASHFHRVQVMVDGFMTMIRQGGKPKPMDAILRLRTYGKAIRGNTNADGVVDWHGDTLLYGHVSLNMGALRGMVHGLVDETRRQLREDVLLLRTGPQGRPRGPEGIVMPRETFVEDLTEDWPFIDWGRLVDNAAETKNRWNFIQDARNKEAFGGVDGNTWLLRRITQNQALHDEWIRIRSNRHDDQGTGGHDTSSTLSQSSVQGSSSRPDDDGRGRGPQRRSHQSPPRGDMGQGQGQGRQETRPRVEIRLGSGSAVGAGQPSIAANDGSQWQWNRQRARKYGQAIRAFRANMLVLMHLSGGQPARGTELVTVQFRNGNDGDARGIFIEDGMVVFVTRYNKTSAISAKSKVIHRYLPHEVGQLVVYYIWLALPFWRLLGQTATRGRVADRSPFIWAPAPDKAWDFPGSQGQSAQKGRAGRTRGGEANEGGGEDREEQDSMDKIFKPEAWDTDKVRRALQRVTTRYTGEKLSILSWRHAAKAIYRRYIRDRDVLQLVERTDMEQDEESSRPGGREAADHQGGHTGQIGEMIYGRSVGEALDSTEAKRIGFRRVSREWHAFLLFDSTVQELKGQGSGKRAGSDMSRSLPLPLPLRLVDTRQQAAREEERRWAQARQVDIQHELEAMLGPDARFRGVQEEALAAIMRQESPVVVVMGTGGGKSMMFMLPARCSSGMTIVVVPLVSLRGNMRERCEELGIESVEWNAQRPQEWASVVFVTPEAAVGETFGHFINRQRAMGRLDRIVIDECHVVLDSGPGGAWRPGMLALRTLTRAEVQMVYLTATLRPADEDMFSQLMGVPTSSETSARTSTGKGMGGVWFRAPTTRPNIRYRIERFNRQRETEEAALKRVVSTAKSKHEGQIIVYCDTVGRTERYARVLGAVCYHRTVGSEEEKRQIVQALRAGQQRVFTATNALGLGVDAAGIRTVVHVGLVRSLRDYVQESGRAGRDGSASEAIIVRAATRAGKRATGDDGEETWEGKKAGVEKVMWEFVEGEGCMRAVLDREMDGWTGPRRCRVGEGEAACQRCHADRTEWFAQAQASDDGVREDVERTDEEEEEGEEFPSDSDVGMIVRHGSFPTSATPQSRQDGAEFEGHSIPSSIPSSITRSITRSTPTSPPTTPETASRAAVQRGVSSSAGSPHGRGRQLARQVNRQGMAEQERSGSKRGRDDPSQAEADMIRDIERKRIQRGVQAGRERAREASQAEEVMELEQMVGVYEEGCIWCRACGDKTEETVLGHRFGACEDEEAWKVRSIIQEVGRCIRWEKNSGCFGCGLPARMCDSWVEIGQTGLYGQGRGGCRKGFVIGVMVALYGAWGSEASAIFGQGMKRYGMQFDETKRPNTEWMEWLGKKIRWGGLESNEACRAMVQLERVRLSMGTRQGIA